jgi:hypothetical protein
MGGDDPHLSQWDSLLTPTTDDFMTDFKNIKDLYV